MTELLFRNIKPLLYQKLSEDSTPLRNITQYEIEYQLQDGGVSHINNMDYPVKHGQILIAKPKTNRSTTGTYQCLAIHFSCSNDFLVNELDRLPTLLSASRNGHIEELLRNANKIQANSIGSSLQLEGILLQILAECIEASQIPELTTKKYQRYTEGIFQTTEYMQRNFAEHITCKQLASQLYISTNFYQKVFKEIMKTSPMQYLLDVRLAQARRLLANTDFSVQEIAEQCGFGCSSYFIYVMRKHLGMTPSKYRKGNQILI